MTQRSSGDRLFVKGGAVSQFVADRLMDIQVDARYLEGGILAWHASTGGPRKGVARSPHHADDAKRRVQS